MSSDSTQPNSHNWISQAQAFGQFTELRYVLSEHKFYLTHTFSYVFSNTSFLSSDYIHFDTFLQLIHPKDGHKLAKISLLLRKGTTHWEFTVRTNPNLADKKYIHFKAQVVNDSQNRPYAVLFFVQDITQYRKIEKRLHRLARIALCSGQAVLLLNPDQKITWVNKRFEVLSGYRLSEIKGKYPAEFLKGELTDNQTLAWVKASLDRRKRIRTELQHYRKNGETYWISLDLVPIYKKNGQLKYYIALMVDITEQKKAEEEKNNLIVQLIDNNKNLEQFSYIVSHNLRGPVARITGLINLFNKEHLADVTNLKIVNFLDDSAQQLDQVIKDLGLILSLRQPDKDSFSNIRLGKLIEDVLQEIQPIIRKTNALVTTDFDTEQRVFAIENHLKNIFIQLISNSVKFVRQDQQPHIHISVTHQTNGYLCLKIHDNGLGIDLKNYGHQLFTIYKRFHLQFEGRGIGLYIVRTLTEAMNGYIEVESEEWKGTTFMIYLRKK